MRDPDEQERFFLETEERLRGIVRRVRRRYPGAARSCETTDDLHQLWLDCVTSASRWTVASDRKQFFAYCYKAATNLLIDRIRKATRQHCDTLVTSIIDGDPRMATQRGMLTRCVMTESERYLRGAVAAKLTDEEWYMFGQIHISGRPQTDLFRELGIKESTGRDRLARIRVKIQQGMEDPMAADDTTDA